MLSGMAGALQSKNPSGTKKKIVRIRICKPVERWNCKGTGNNPAGEGTVRPLRLPGNSIETEGGTRGGKKDTKSLKKLQCI